MSDAQAGAFEAIFHDNYRPVQPLNERAFLISFEMEPQALPVSGGETWPLSGILLILGTLAAGSGLYLRRQKMM